MIIIGTHYDSQCLCESCKEAGNRRLIGGGVYNINSVTKWKKLDVDQLSDSQAPDHDMSVGEM